MSRDVLIWFPHWDAHALALDSPPTATAVASVRRGRITCATYAAQRAGVTQGMKTALAQHLCPDLLCLPEDPTRSARSFDAVLTALEEVTPAVVTLTPGIAWVRSDVGARWYGSEEALCDEIVNAVAIYTGVDVQVGAGRGVLGAWVGALYRDALSDDDARVEALELRHVVPLFPTKRSEIEDTIDQLGDFGVHTVGDLRVFGRAALCQRFGTAGVALAQLLNDDDTPFGSAPHRTHPTIEETVRWEEPAVTVDTVMTELMGLSRTFLTRLVDAQLSAQTVTVEVVWAVPELVAHRLLRDTVARSREDKGRALWRAERGIRVVRHWALTDFPRARDLTDRIRWQINAWQDRLRQQKWDVGGVDDGLDCDGDSGVVEVVVRADDMVAIDEFSARLWGNRSGADRRGEMTALRVQSLVGEDHVCRPVVSGGYDPVSRVTMMPWGRGEREQPAETATALPSTSVRTTLRPHLTRAWSGGIEGEAPSLVCERGIPVRILSASTETVSVTPEGRLSARATALEWSAAEKNAAVEDTPVASAAAENEAEARHLLSAWGAPPWGSQPRSVRITSTRGPWVICGRWWESGEASDHPSGGGDSQTDPHGARAWLMVDVESAPQPLLCRFRRGQWEVVGAWHRHSSKVDKARGKPAQLETVPGMSRHHVSHQERLDG